MIHDLVYSYECSSSPVHASAVRMFSLSPLPPSSSGSSPSPPFSFASSVRATLLFDSLITSLSPPPPKLCNASSLANSTRVKCREALAGGLSVAVFSLWNQRIQEWGWGLQVDACLSSVPSSHSADKAVVFGHCPPAQTKHGNLGMRLYLCVLKAGWEPGRCLSVTTDLVLLVHCNPIRPAAPGNSNTITKKTDVWYACASWLHPGTTS